MAKRKIESKTYNLKLPTDTANLDIIREFVARIAQNSGFSEEDIHRIELAVDEASTNVIKHAYRGEDKDKAFIRLEVKTFADRLEISVIDNGKGFEPKRIKTPEMDVYFRKMKRGGLGIYLIKTLMDHVEYFIKPGVKNRVKMVKYLSQG